MNLLKLFKRRPTDAEILLRLFTEQDEEKKRQASNQLNNFHAASVLPDDQVGECFEGEMTEEKFEFAHSIDSCAAEVCVSMAEYIGKYTVDDRITPEEQVVSILDESLMNMHVMDGTPLRRFVFPDGDRNLVLRQKVNRYFAFPPIVYLIRNVRAVYDDD